MKKILVLVLMLLIGGGLFAQSYEVRLARATGGQYSSWTYMDDEVMATMAFTQAVEGFRYVGFAFIYYIYQDAQGEWKLEDRFFRKAFYYSILNGEKLSVEYYEMSTFEGSMDNLITSVSLFESPSWYNFTIGVNRDGDRFIALNNEIFYED